MSSFDKEYDVIVIGAGAGMIKVAKPAFQLGLKTAIIERARFGGTCLNRGFVSSPNASYSAASLPRCTSTLRTTSAT